MIERCAPVESSDSLSFPRLGILYRATGSLVRTSGTLGVVTRLSHPPPSYLFVDFFERVVQLLRRLEAASSRSFASSFRITFSRSRGIDSFQLRIGSGDVLNSCTNINALVAP